MNIPDILRFPVFISLALILVQTAWPRDNIRPTDPLKQGENEMSDYVWDPNRRDWDKGYIRDASGRYQPLKGQHPDQFGDGGGSPRVYYRVDEDKSEQKKTT